jgi:hypothetical protein
MKNDPMTCGKYGNYQKRRQLANQDQMQNGLLG